MRILLSQINPTVGDLKGNTDKILKGIVSARSRKADVVVFPELSITGYPPDDFLLLPHFIQGVEEQLNRIVALSKGLAVVVGLPRHNPSPRERALHNSAAVIEDGVLLGYQDKVLLPTYDVFDEHRYFEPAKELKIWELKGKRVGILICEDIWQHSEASTWYHRDPVEELQKLGPEVLINISASPFQSLKFEDRLRVCSKPAVTLNCPVFLCNQIGGNDSLIFDGFSICVSNKGKLLDYAKGFEEDELLVDLDYLPKEKMFDADPTANLYQALVLGVRDYFGKLGFKSACLGLSGGVDSALVAHIAADALGKENVLAIRMPSRYSKESSMSDATQLIRNLGIEVFDISIESPFQSMLDLLEPLFRGKAVDTTEENLQARIRGMILMAISNKFGHIVLSTGNKSEMAMGYATLYGDMCGGLGVLNDITKRQVYQLVKWINRNGEIIPRNIIEKPPSAELRPGQKDSDSLPDYDIVDNVLQEYVEHHQSPQKISRKFGYSLDLVMDLVQRIHRNEYKRRQSPPGLRVSSKAFSVGRRFPIVQRWV